MVALVEVRRADFGFGEAEDRCSACPWVGSCPEEVLADQKHSEGREGLHQGGHLAGKVGRLEVLLSITPSLFLHIVHLPKAPGGGMPPGGKGGAPGGIIGNPPGGGGKGGRAG